MSETIWQRLDGGGRKILPFATALGATLLGAAVWPLPHLGDVAPPLALMTVYYWSLYRPDLFRPGMAFLIGLLNDILHFLPLGLTAILFVAAQAILLRQRRYIIGHSFFMVWFGFIVTNAIVFATQWLAVGVIGWRVVPVVPVLIQAVLAVVIFPLPCWALINLQRLALSPER